MMLSRRTTEVGGLEALVASGTATLDIQWCFGNLAVV